MLLIILNCHITVSIIGEQFHGDSNLLSLKMTVIEESRSLGVDCFLPSAQTGIDDSEYIAKENLAQLRRGACQTGIWDLAEPNNVSTCPLCFCKAYLGILGDVESNFEVRSKYVD